MEDLGDDGVLGVLDLLVIGDSVADVGLDVADILRWFGPNIGSEPFVISSGLTSNGPVCELDLLKKPDTERIPFPFAEDDPALRAVGVLGVPVTGVALRSCLCAGGGGLADVFRINGTRLCMVPSMCDSFMACILSAKLWGFWWSTGVIGSAASLLVSSSSSSGIGIDGSAGRDSGDEV